MERLTLVNWMEFVSRLKELGFEGQFYGGKHPNEKRKFDSHNSE